MTSTVPGLCLPDMLTRQAIENPTATAFSFLADGESISDTITFAELDQRSAALARHLRATTRLQDRVLLLYPPGIDYIVAVLGCLRAGVVAVPAYPPRPNRPDTRIASIVADCLPSVTLTDADTHASLTRQRTGTTPAPVLPNLTAWSGRGRHDDVGELVLPELHADDIALLQYTSGSTAEPKGVVLTHGNLAANLVMIAEQFELHRGLVGLSWLPPYHDMGLIGFIFVAVHVGCHMLLMPPAAFVQRPLRFLRTIERFGVCTTAGPNFAFEQCLRKVSAEERATLDLRSWRRALNGAEPIRASTMREFAAAFAVAGFDAHALTPCYGMAEATLLVSGKPMHTEAIIRRFDDAALARHEVRPLATGADDEGCELVSSGRLAPGADLVIVEIDGTSPLPEGRAGEICIAGPHVSRGYWNDRVDRAELFVTCHRTAYLRTGDLGFMLDDELFVTGRLKDIIIIRGRNHYPQDIEATASSAHPLLQLGAAAALSTTVDAEERLVVVAEVTRAFRGDHHDEVMAAIARAVATTHEIPVHEVVLLRPGHLPRTSSGKVRRRPCHAMWQAGTLALAVEPPQVVPTPGAVGGGEAPTSQVRSGEVRSGEAPSEEPLATPPDARRRALIRFVANAVGVAPEDMDGDRPIVHYGLDSLRLLELQAHLEQHYGYRVSAEAFFNLLTLHELLAALDGAAPEPVVPSLTAATERHRDTARTAAPDAVAAMDLSLFFFSDNASSARGNPYQLMLDAARFADTAGFKAIWIPERHFHRFGGLYPNPAVVASALSMITRHVRLRAGSVVLPLHHPARVAEEWAVVDNLSGGRVDLAFTSGWNANDFALAPERYASRADVMMESLRMFEALWHGATCRVPNGTGEMMDLTVFPRPLESRRPYWLTCTTSRERFERAGALGANVLTAMLMQTADELVENIAAYRASREQHGFNPADGVVTLMLHTYIGEDLKAVRAVVREPLHDYLLSSITLWKLAEESLDKLSPADRERVLDLALERYIRTSSLIGTVESTRATAEQLHGVGVNEIACLIDFGIDDDRTLDGVKRIARLRQSVTSPTVHAAGTAADVPHLFF